MSIKELIEKVGIENIHCQWIHESFVGANFKAGQGVDLTIATNQINLDDLILQDNPAEWKKRGIVVWFDKERMPKS